MKTDDFDYNLPKELIAQTPLKDRTSSKMMVLDKITGKYEDKNFTDLIDYVNPGDTLVLNDTKVIPARLIGHKIETDAVIEVLMLKDLGNDEWECLTRPAKRIKEGTIVKFSDELSCKCTFVGEDGIRKYKPDIFVMCEDATKKGESFTSAPKLIFEILSKSTAKFDKGRKYDTYEKFGVLEYNLVEQTGFIVQHKLIDGAYQIVNVYKNNDEYISTVFPDLKIKLQDIFE